MKKIMLMSVAVASLAMFAADLSFWGSESSNATNSIASVSASADATVDARSRTWLVSDGIDFSSSAVGLIIFIR